MNRRERGLNNKNVVFQVVTDEFPGQYAGR